MVDRWHLITGEYPPQPGGVSDYTRLTARGLAAAGDEVHVWTSWCGGADPADPGVTVHRLPGRFGPRGLAALDAGVRGLPGPARHLVQYTPHAFGWKAMNVPFCLCLRAWRRCPVWVMFHEVAFPIRPGQPWRRNLLGRVHGWMARLLLRSAERVFLSIPGWEPLLRGLAGPCPPMTWLPVPSNLAARPDAEATARVRRRLASDDVLVIGSFGTYGPLVADLLTAVLPPLLEKDADRVGLLLGRGGDGFARTLEAAHPSLRGRLVAPGELPEAELAAHLAACDLLVQPYPDGVSSRRTSLMAGLALGAPIVTTEGALTEPLWREAGGVGLAAVDRPSEFVAAAETLLTDPGLRAGLGRRGRDFYQEHFAPEQTIRLLRQQTTPADVEPLGVAR